MAHEQRFNPISQLALLLAFCGAGFIASGVIGIIISSALHIHNTENLINELMKPENVSWNRLIQVLGSFFVMGAPALAVASLNGGNAVAKLGFNEAMSRWQILLIVFIMAAGIMVSGALGEVNQIIPLPKGATDYFTKKEEEYNRAVLSLSNMKTIFDYVMSLIILAFLPAIFEEMLFRGCLQKIMISLTRNAFWGIFITSLIFSAIHFSYYGFLSRLFLGLTLGYIFYYSKNLWLNITAHFLNNAYAVTGMYIISRSGKLNTDVMEENIHWYYGIIPALIFIFLFIIFKKESTKVTALASVTDADTL